MAKQNEEKMSEGLWIPEEIIGIPRSVLDPLGKMILAHIYSFGKKGCFQSNETIAGRYGISERPVGDRIAAMKKADLVYVKFPQSPYRTLWAKQHPDVQKAVYLPYRTWTIPKAELEDGQKPTSPLRQNCPSNNTKNIHVTETKSSKSLRNKCPATNTDTNTYTHTETRERTHNDISSEDSAHKNSKYTLEEVIETAERLNISKSTAKEFFDYYNSQDWLRGNRLPITNLKSALENWRNRQRSFGNSKNEPEPVLRDSKGRTPLQRYNEEHK
jgi:hypothetical protein